MRGPEARGAVLLIDGVDSFLQNREAPVRSWEVSQPNDFLTAHEACRDFCLCVTNQRGGTDPAAMRRFSLRVEFCSAGPWQVRAPDVGCSSPCGGGDGSVLLRVQVTSEPGCISWLLGIGVAAEVLEPAWLREKLVELEGMLAKYAAK